MKASLPQCKLEDLFIYCCYFPLCCILCFMQRSLQNFPLSADESARRNIQSSVEEFDSWPCVFDFQQRLKFGQIFFFIKSGREHVLRHDGHVFSSRKTPAHKQGALQDAPEAAVLTTVPYVQLLYSNLQVKGIN